ncbi:MAG: alpha/beta hydrolase [Propionibacteriales bacterium]|nr:alpha/beta hydrolase [Propionibacteriales bacterium]
MTTVPPSSSARGVLLVHGAWHTGEGTWRKVAEGLRALGVPAAIAELHRGSVEADTAAAAEALAGLAEHGPAVAVGHSYGGHVISGLPVASLHHLVYLCAIQPTEDETTLGLMGSTPGTTLMAGIRWSDEAANLSTIDPEHVKAAFYGHSSDEVAARHTAELVSQQMTVGSEPPVAVAWRQVPSTYIVCGDDQALNPVLQRRLAERASAVVEWDSDHTPFVSRTGDVVELLAGLAGLDAS